jgi:hypothetical protein
MSIYTIHDFFSNFCICKSTYNIDTKSQLDVKIFKNYEDAEFHMDKLYIEQKEKLSDLSHNYLISNSELNEIAHTNITKYRVCRFQSQEKQIKACQNKCMRDRIF